MTEFLELKMRPILSSREFEINRSRYKLQTYFGYPIIMGVSCLELLFWVAMSSAVILPHSFSGSSIAILPNSVNRSGVIQLPITRRPKVHLVSKRQSAFPLGDFGHGEGYLINS
jgi:hypothetical protein